MHTIARKTLPIVAAAAALPAAGCSTGPAPLVPSEYDQVSPAIDGSSVAWEDSRNEETQGTDVFMYEVASATERLVAGGNGDQEQPAISGRYVAWIDSGKLRAMDRASGATFNVTAGPATQTDPALCGSVVAWTDSRNATPDVYARDLSGGGEIAVATTSASEAYPACDGGRVVYMRAPAVGSTSIRLYNLANGQTTVVADKPWNEWRPAISGDRVVWQAWPNQPDPVEGIQIFGTRLSTGEGFEVTTGPGHQTAPAISGSVVAWEDARSDNTRVWWRDLATTAGEQEVAAIQPGRQQAPALSGRSLAYESNATGTTNIFLANLGQ